MRAFLSVKEILQNFSVLKDNLKTLLPCSLSIGAMNYFRDTFLPRIKHGYLLPRLHKISPPMVHQGYPQTDLPSPGYDFARYQSNGSPYPLDMLFSVAFRQYQIPYPQRKVVSQLGTKQVYPVSHKLPQWQMTQKLIGKLPNPLLTPPSAGMCLHQGFYFAFLIGYHYIIGIFLKKRFLSLLFFLSFPANKIPIFFLPLHLLRINF